MADLTWKELELGGIISSPGNASAYRTGDWRSDRPTKDYDKCIKCGMCWLYCPEGAIKLRDDGMYDFDLFYCKGCGICAAECPKKCITMVEEEE
ncbi:MAG: 4Fe-4S binding protein [Dehalococcoidia bacterium]